MRFSILLPLLALLTRTLASPEALGEQGAVTTQAATQMATTTTAGSLFTSDGTTSVTWVLFTQTFATTALGTWDLGATPGSGAIGLGTIAGTVGGLFSKRAMPTPELGSA